MTDKEQKEEEEKRKKKKKRKRKNRKKRKDKKEIDFNRTRSDTLNDTEVDELVNELQAFQRTLVDDIAWLHETLPHRLVGRIRDYFVGHPYTPDSRNDMPRSSQGQHGLSQMPSRKREDARLRILAALGLCLENARCVAFINTHLLDKSEVYMSSSEMEALYRRRLESSTALDRLKINIPANASEKWAPESWRLLADLLLRAEVLEAPLSALSQLAKAVADSGCGPSPVQEVRIAPNLKELSIETGALVDEAIAELLGEAIASHQSLLTLQIQVNLSELDRGGGTSFRTVSTGEKRMGPVGHLLSRAFLCHPRNTSIRSLRVWFFSGSERGSSIVMKDLEVLSQVLITELQLIGPDSIQSCHLRGFFDNLLLNGAHFQSLHLHVNYRQGLGFDADSFDMFVDLLKSDSLHALKDVSLFLEGRRSFRSEVEAFDWSVRLLHISRPDGINIYSWLYRLQAS